MNLFSRKGRRRKVSSLESLSDELLLDSYRKAVEFGLSKDFLDLLLDEIKNRGISLQSIHAAH